MGGAGGVRFGGGRLCRENCDGSESPTVSPEKLWLFPPASEFTNEPHCGWYAPEHMAFMSLCSSL